MNEENEVLKRNVKREISKLKELTSEMKEIIERFEEEPDMVEQRAMGSILHDFYCGVERIFKRISEHYKGGLPGGENWHIELLDSMFNKKMKERRSVINKKTYEDLKELLAFRHIFRNIYGFELKWDRFRHLSLNLDKILEEVKENITDFISRDV
ncbi:MAG: hypothetical protein U9N06_03350 [candidate division WOR-3 bacterium]|nr:hypothetical protein [candidate division WOR-3 bacterium]